MYCTLSEINFQYIKKKCSYIVVDASRRYDYIVSKIVNKDLPQSLGNILLIQIRMSLNISAP